MSPQPQITLARNILAEFEIESLDNAQHLGQRSFDGVDWHSYRLQDRLCVMEDGRFAVFIHERAEGRLVFICVLQGGKATLEDTARIAQLENAIAGGHALPEGVGFSPRSLPTVFIANYKGIGGFAGREAVRKGTAASRQLLSNSNFRGLVLYTPERDIVSLMVDITAKILGPSFQVAQNENEAFTIARQLLSKPSAKAKPGA